MVLVKMCRTSGVVWVWINEMNGSFTTKKYCDWCLHTPNNGLILYNIFFKFNPTLRFPFWHSIWHYLASSLKYTHVLYKGFTLLQCGIAAATQHHIQMLGTGIMSRRQTSGLWSIVGPWPHGLKRTVHQHILGITLPFRAGPRSSRPPLLRGYPSLSLSVPRQSPYSDSNCHHGKKSASPENSWQYVMTALPTVSRRPVLGCSGAGMGVRTWLTDLLLTLAGFEHAGSGWQSACCSSVGPAKVHGPILRYQANRPKGGPLDPQNLTIFPCVVCSQTELRVVFSLSPPPIPLLSC